MESQVVEMGLPPAPIKDGDTRSAKWNGLGQVELDAIDPKILKRMCKKAIDDVFDESIHDEIMALEEMETETYKIALREYVNTL
jgi:RecA-family ATPase